MRDAPSSLGEIAAEALVGGFDDAGFLGIEAAEELEEIGGVEGLEVVRGPGALGRARSHDDDDGAVGGEVLELLDEFGAGHVADASVENNAADAGEDLEGFEGFVAAVGGDDVELGGFDDQLARGDAAGVFAIDDEKTGADHGFIID